MRAEESFGTKYEIPFSLSLYRVAIFSEFNDSLRHFPHLFLIPLKIVAIPFLPVSYLLSAYESSKQKALKERMRTKKEFQRSLKKNKSKNEKEENEKDKKQKQLKVGGGVVDMDDYDFGMEEDDEDDDDTPVQRSILLGLVFRLNEIAKSRVNFWGTS